MRKLIIILLLLISTYSFGQAVLSGSKGWDGFLTSGADSLIARMESAVGKTLTQDGKILISNMFKMYKDSLSITSLQNFFDVLYFLDIGVETAGKLNWVKDAHNITNVNGVVFDTTGATSASTKYLSCDYNPSTNAVNFKLNTNTLSFYSKTNLYSTGVEQYVVGHIYTPRLRWEIFNSSSIMVFESNGDVSAQWIPSHSNNVQGLITAVRVDTLNYKWYRDNNLITSVGSKPTTGLANTNGDMRYLVDTANSISLIFICKDVDATQIRQIYNIIKYWQNNKNSITFFNP
jgi:hypothetical protein